MKYIKYASFVVLLFISMLLINELYILHLDDFTSEFSYMTFYRPTKLKRITPEVMKSDLQTMAKKYNIKLFVVQNEIKSNQNKNIIIYTTDDIRNQMMEKVNVEEGNYKGLFLGNVKVIFRSFKEIKNIDDYQTFFYIGTKENAVKYKQELVDIYGGKFPQDGYTSKSNFRNIACIWAIFYAFILLLSIYEMTLKKKENMVKIIMGESKIYLLCSYVLEEFLYYFLLWEIGTWILRKKLYINFGWEITWKCFIIFLFVNALVKALVLNRYNFKKDIYQLESKNVLVLGYLYKIVVQILIVFLISGCVELVISGVSYYSQREILKNYKNYSYCKINCDDSDDMKDLSNELYIKKYTDGKTLSLNELEDMRGGRHYIYADMGAKEYLSQMIPLLRDKDINNKVLCFIPEKLYNQEIKKETKELWGNYVRKSEKIEFISYEEDIDVLCNYSPDFIKRETKYERNPIIILNGKTDTIFFDPYIIEGTMYKMKYTEWSTWLKNSKIDKELSFKTNVWSNYMDNWKQVYRYLVLGTTLVILLFLNVFIDNTLLEYEYKVHAKEIMLMKIFGYSIFGRYKSIVAVSIISSVIGVFISEVLLYYIFESNVIIILMIGIVQILLELILLVEKSFSMEKEQVQKAIKGGIL